MKIRDLHRFMSNIVRMCSSVIRIVDGGRTRIRQNAESFQPIDVIVRFALSIVAGGRCQVPTVPGLVREETGRPGPHCAGSGASGRRRLVGRTPPGIWRPVQRRRPRSGEGLRSRGWPGGCAGVRSRGWLALGDPARTGRPGGGCRADVPLWWARALRLGRQPASSFHGPGPPCGGGPERGGSRLANRSVAAGALISVIGRM